MDDELVKTVIMIIVFVVAPIVQRLLKKSEKDTTWDDSDWKEAEPEPYPVEAPPPPPAYPEPYPANTDFNPYPSAPPPPPEPSPLPEWEQLRQQAVKALESLEKSAETVARTARVERITNRFAEPLEGFVAKPARQWINQLKRSNAAPPQELYNDVEVMELVLGQTEAFIGQRHNKALAPRLGDADSFALSCYGPVVEFAEAERLGLTSHTPVTEFGPFDLSIWVGFFPTGLAPLFLPPDFFDRIAWWPALAHEIGHDFYNSIDHLDAELRENLGLPSQEVGSRPLAFDRQGLSMHELVRVFGGWFEELFCDVFGALMCGPAYAWTMIEHFSTPYDPTQICRVRVDRTGRRYDEHPPRHLRFLAAVEVVELAGSKQDAEALREEWARLHGEPEAIYFPIAGQLIGIPIQPLAAVAIDIATRLYGDRMKVFNGRALGRIPGIDFGPHAHAEAERVRDELLRGLVPHHTGARSVVSGAVLARMRAPERERELIQLARAAIRAEGTFEDDVDAYDRAMEPASAVAELGGVNEARDAFLLHTILSPPPSLRRMGIGVRTGGFLSRRGW